MASKKSSEMQLWKRTREAEKAAEFWERKCRELIECVDTYETERKIDKSLLAQYVGKKKEIMAQIFLDAMGSMVQSLHEARMFVLTEDDAPSAPFVTAKAGLLMVKNRVRWAYVVQQVEGASYGKAIEGEGEAGRAGGGAPH